MKVLMITPSFFPIVGGTERVVQDLAFELNKYGIHTDVMTFNMDEKWNPVWKEEIKQDGLRVFRVPAINVFSKMRINPLAILSGTHVLPKLSFVKRLRDYDLLHFHDDVDLSFSVFSWFVKRPKIFQCHTLAGTYPYYKSSYFPRKILNKVANYYICVSNAAKKLLVDLDVPESEIFTLPNGVDTEKFKKNQAERIDNSILYAGRIIKPKGLHVLLDALEYLDIPVCLKIAGPKQEQGYLEKNLSRKGKQKMGIHEVEWLGSVDQEKIVRVYQQASVFVNPTLREDFGIVNLEALSCETPVIASDTMGLNEVIRNGVNGILVQPNNPRQIANALKKLLENKGLRKKYGRNGRRMIKAHFSWDSIAREAVKIYEKVIKMEKN